MLSVLLFLWSERTGPRAKFADHFEFTPDDLCRLARGVRTNLRLPHRLIAITDFPPDRFPSDIEYVPLADHFGELRRLGGCWLRLKCFAPELGTIIGPRCAWIDLDSIVTGDLTPLFDRPEPMVLYKSRSIQGQRWNGSVILFSPAENRDIWTEFDPERSPQFVRELRGGMKIGPRGTDQAWLHSRRDEDTPHWTAEDGILHYGKAAFRELPEHARLLTFPGLDKPTSIKVRRKSPWVKQHWPLPGEDVPPAGFDVTPWPVTPSVAQAKPGRFKSLLKQRQEARAERVRMLNAGTVG